MKRKQVYSKVTGDSISDDYLILVWSKMKLSESLKE